MKTYIADIIPSIKRFSDTLDNLSKLSDQHWVSLGDINEVKKVYIFRKNNELLISNNGVVEKCNWEFLGNQSILIDTKEGSFMLKHGFFDDNIIALKLDNTDSYTFFVNETKYDNELNTINDVIHFLTKKYLSKKKDNKDTEIKPANPEILTNKQQDWIKNPNLCPACGFSGVEHLTICPDCGLTLQ
jgi:hypothetical protein